MNTTTRPPTVMVPLLAALTGLGTASASAAQATPGTKAEVADLGAVAISSADFTHDLVVPGIPVLWTSQLLDGKTSEIDQSGSTVVVGGRFGQVQDRVMRMRAALTGTVNSGESR